VEIAILVFDGLTALDAVGPAEVLWRIPGAELRFTGKERGPVQTETGPLRVFADHELDEVTAPDVLLVPGGFGTRRLLADEAVLDWVRSVHERTRWTTSVCTGSLVLAAAGILDGLRATGHWLQMERLGRLGATPTPERVVREGKVITAAGVSSGIDMALHLAAIEAGEDVAQAIQLAIEYDPQPPFDAGSPDRAPAHVVDQVRAAAAAREPPL
jgi:transcriptional regulator GlxA family with amidase domain